MKIAGIDPGLASGGMVLLDHAEDTVLKVKKVSAKKDTVIEVTGDNEFTAAVIRAGKWVDIVEKTLREWQPDLVVIESFADLNSKRYRGFVQKRWQTPLVIGMLVSRLNGVYNIQYQHPAVLHQLRVERAEALQDRTLHGGLLVSEHLVSAWAHAVWASMRISEGPSEKSA